MGIKNRKLMESVRMQPCAACGSLPPNHAHHHRGGAYRDDVEENVSPLCGGVNGCHSLLHDYPDTFKRRFGEKKYEELRSYKNGLQYPQIREKYKLKG